MVALETIATAGTLVGKLLGDMTGATGVEGIAAGVEIGVEGVEIAAVVVVVIVVVVDVVVVLGISKRNVDSSTRPVLHASSQEGLTIGAPFFFAESCLALETNETAI